MNEYKAPDNESYKRIFSFVVFFSFSLIVVFIGPFYALPKALSFQPESAFDAYIVVSVGFILGLWALIFFLLPMAREFWRAHFFLELHDDELVGYNLWKHQKSIRFDEIKTIQTEWRSFLHGMYPNVKVVTGSGEKIVVHHGIRPLGKCVEAIRKRAVNVEKVDYRGLDKKRKIWGAVD